MHGARLEVAVHGQAERSDSHSTQAPIRATRRPPFGGTRAQNPPSMVA